MTSFKAYLGVARAPFLLLPVTLVASGAAAAAYDGAFSWPDTLLALGGLVALHMAVNILNEASDFSTGIDLRTERTPFSGGSGTLPAGAMSVRGARLFGLACAAIGGAIGVYFLVKVGWSFLPVMLLGAVAVLAYTPWLTGSGFGELFAGLGLGALPVWGTALVQGHTPGAAAWAAAVPAFLMTFNLLLLNEFPDEAADREGGRRNLVLIFGRRTAALIYAVAALLTPAGIVAAVVLRALPPLALAAALPSVLLAAPLRWALGGAHDPLDVPALGSNVVWNLATNAALAAALVITVALR
jgi:1,4-dihydroxy-2-naphthoate octaprenyltransferase